MSQVNLDLYLLLGNYFMRPPISSPPHHKSSGQCFP